MKKLPKENPYGDMWGLSDKSKNEDGFFKYRRLDKDMGLALFLLILVIIPHNPLAITSNRATRWLGIRGVFQFQPSEIAKLAVIVYFSDTISKKREKMLTWRQGILPYVALLAVCLLYTSRGSCI